MAASASPSSVQTLAMPDEYDTVAGERGIMPSGEKSSTGPLRIE